MDNQPAIKLSRITKGIVDVARGVLFMVRGVWQRVIETQTFETHKFHFIVYGLVNSNFIITS